MLSPLTRRTPSSFLSTDPAAVVELLLEHDYHTIDTKSAYEYGRLIKAGAVAVVFKSGSILRQGGNPQPLIALVQLAVDQAEAVTQ